MCPWSVPQVLATAQKMRQLAAAGAGAKTPGPATAGRGSGGFRTPASARTPFSGEKARAMLASPAPLSARKQAAAAAAKENAAPLTPGAAAAAASGAVGVAMAGAGGAGASTSSPTLLVASPLAESARRRWNIAPEVRRAGREVSC